MDQQIKKILGTQKLKSTGYSGGGSISSGSTYETDSGQLVFVKVNHKEHAKKMFDGEHAGLHAISATNTIIVPKSFGVVQLPGSSTSGIILEHLNMKSLRNQSLLGQQLAELHIHNEKQLKLHQKRESHITKLPNTSSTSSTEGEPVTQFGFDISTSCGYISMNNQWSNDWTKFYISQRLQPQVDGLISENSSNRSKLSTLWGKCQSKIETALNTIKPIPALLHGDLWSGNLASNDQNQPIIFDPAAYYGHSEFDLGIAHMFGGFTQSFHESYHSIIPKTQGFEHRLNIYELFHHLNHWAHFGGGYESSTLGLMNKIISDDRTN